MPTLEYLTEAAADDSNDPMLPLLTIEHPDLSEPLRFVRDFKPFVSRGETYQPFPFNFIRPGQGEDGPSRARIAIDNIDQRIVRTIRSLSTPPTLKIEIVLASIPDTVQETFPLFRMMTTAGDRFTVEAELIDVDDDAEPLCQWSFTPSLAPALHN
jgi:hypothetical protein